MTSYQKPDSVSGCIFKWVDWKCRTWKWRTNMQGMKLQDMKMQDMKLQDKISTILLTQEASQHIYAVICAWPHGSSATPEQTHLTAVVYSCCRCRRWRGSRPSRCSCRWCRGWWQVVCVIFVAGGLVVVSHWLDYFLCAQAGDLSPICCDLPLSSNWSKNMHKRLLSLFRLRRLPLLS